jgi:5'-nucleotidase
MKKILVTNDDGIYARGLWALVTELKKISEVIVVAPDREQSAIGTALTLHHPLRVQKVKPEISDVEAYALSGTPGDCVIMAISNLAKNGIGLVISGINNGPNTGDDVFISGTVGGAMQAYWHGHSTIAVSLSEVDSKYIDNAARFTTFLVDRLNFLPKAQKYFLNVNIPSVPVQKIKGIEITHLSTTGYCDTVEEGYDGRRHYYWLKHQKTTRSVSRQTDAWAINRNNISITPLHSQLFGKSRPVLNGNVTELLEQFKAKQGSVD